MIIAVLLAGLADRLAAVAVALRRPALELGRKLSARTVVAARQRRRVHRQRPQHALLNEFVDRRAVSTLERKLQQDEAGMGIEMLLDGRPLRLPGVERGDEFGKR